MLVRNKGAGAELWRQEKLGPRLHLAVACRLRLKQPPAPTRGPEGGPGRALSALGSSTRGARCPVAGSKLSPLTLNRTEFLRKGQIQCGCGANGKLRKSDERRAARPTDQPPGGCSSNRTSHRRNTFTARPRGDAVETPRVRLNPQNQFLKSTKFP